MIHNKGLGAGGKNTNESGIPFENKTYSCIFEFLKNKVIITNIGIFVYHIETHSRPTIGLFIALVRLLYRVVQATNLSRPTTNDEYVSIWQQINATGFEPVPDPFSATHPSLQGLQHCVLASPCFRQHHATCLCSLQCP